MEKKTVSFSKWENWTATCKSIKLEHTLTPSIKMQNGLKTERHNTIKLQEQKIGKTFFDINHSNIFLHQCPKAMEIKAKINDTKAYIQTYKLLHSKGNRK